MRVVKPLKREKNVILSEANNRWSIFRARLGRNRNVSLTQNDNARLSRLNAVRLQRITTSSVDLDYKLSIRIDVAAVHTVCIKRQSNVAIPINCDQTARAAELFHRVQSGLRRVL